MLRKIIEEILPDGEERRACLADLAAIFLQSQTGKKIIWHGRGSNGKTTLLNIVRQTFGRDTPLLEMYEDVDLPRSDPAANILIVTCVPPADNEAYKTVHFTEKFFNTGFSMPQEIDVKQEFTELLREML